nr:protin armadillo repeat [Hymenolepis microstoma]
MGNLVMSDVKMIEEQLLSVKGIISITFQLNKLRVIVMALTTVSKEIILNKVNSVCENLASKKSQFDISAHLLSRQKSTVSRQGIKRSRTIRSGSASVADRGQDSMLKQSSLSQVVEGSEIRAASQRPAPPPKLKPYLSDEADVFEVDEKRGAPLPRDASINDGGAQVTGLGGWLSDFLERTLFW